LACAVEAKMHSMAIIIVFILLLPRKNPQ